MRNIPGLQEHEESVGHVLDLGRKIAEQPLDAPKVNLSDVGNMKTVCDAYLLGKLVRLFDAKASRTKKK